MLVFSPASMRRRSRLRLPRPYSNARNGVRKHCSICQAARAPVAVGAGGELARLARTLRHQCLLAQEFLEVGNAAEARELLERSLGDHEYAPGPIRRRNSLWASEARRLQKLAEGR